MTLLGIDLGTTGVKATLAQADGSFITAAYRPYVAISEEVQELDPLKIWNQTKSVLQEVAQVSPEPIIGLSISSFGESFVLLDEADKPLMNTLLYSDERGSTEAKELEQKFGKSRLQQVTGLSVNKSYSLSKLLWIKKEWPTLFAKIASFMPISTFIYYQLSGVKAVDYSLAARTYLLNYREKIWDTDLVTYVGLSEAVFPKLVEIGKIFGQISDERAHELGLNPGIQLVMGGHDQVCCAIGSGVCKEGQALDGMGTVDCITPLFQLDTVDSQQMLAKGYACVPYQQNLYTTYAYIYDGGALTKWFRKHYEWYEDFNQLEAHFSKEPSTVYVLPHFSGAATPYQDDAACGLIYGLTTQTTRHTIYQAILEGIAFEMNINLEQLEQAGIMIDEIIASGGGSQSDKWLQIKANIYNKPVSQLVVKESGTMGVILLAGVATGVMPSLEEAMTKNCHRQQTFYPQKAQVHAYQESFKIYKRLYHAQMVIRKGAGMWD